jgi:hypothetical protein
MNGEFCPRCEGIGYITCPRCSGAGKKVVYPGRSRVLCDRCEGERALECPLCDGTGTAETELAAV